MSVQLFPVQALNANITHILSEIISADILGSISAGLKNDITFIDQGGHITDVAHISKNFDNTCSVYLSASYCQYLWLICDVVIKSFDFYMVMQSCSVYNITLNSFKEEIKQELDNKAIIEEALSQINRQTEVEQCIDYLARMRNLIGDDNGKSLNKQIQIEKELISELVDPLKPIDSNKLNTLSLNDSYEEKINSVYCYGIAFVLLHELSHFALGHLDKTEEMEDERSADLAAFWNMYSDLSPDKLFSANCGILCELFSLLYLNPQLKDDGIHPREDKRIWEVYETIKKDNEKYTILCVYMFDYWANTNHIPNYPQNFERSPHERIKDIKEFFNEWGK